NATGAAIGEANDAAATYSWSPSTGLSSATLSNPIANPSTTTTYTVTKTTTANGCTATASVTVTVNTTPPDVHAGTDAQMDCTIPSIQLSGSSSTPGAQYSWIATNGGNISANANTATPTVTIFGKYILTITDP